MNAKILRVVFLPWLVFAASCARDRTPVGPAGGGSHRTPTRQIVKPAGDSLTFNGRPVDLALSPDAATLFLKDNRGIVVIDTRTWRIRQELPFGKDLGGSMHGVVVSGDGARLYATTAQHLLFEGIITKDGTLSWARTIALPGPSGDTDPSHATGIALASEGRRAYVCLSRNNALAEIDLERGELVRQIPVGVAPYDVILADAERTAVVSNWGGRHPQAGDTRALSSGTPVVVDERGVASTGCVTEVDLATGAIRAMYETGLHPTELAMERDEGRIYVADANSDTITVIDRAPMGAGKIRGVSSAMGPGMGFGSAPNALVLDESHGCVYVANGGSNVVAVFDAKMLHGEKGSMSPQLIPTGWYPGALALGSDCLYVASVKGLGSRNRNPKHSGWDVFAYTGVVSKVPLPDARRLARFTDEAMRLARIDRRTELRSARWHDGAPVPVPNHPNQPSVFKHVVYIIKENRTYDQVFGDIEKGNGDPSLCIFGREITPNHHALAEQFVLLDNYYCNGVLSADGHAWATEGNVTDHLEKSFGGFTRSYTFGDDPLTYSSSGFIWDFVLEKGLRFRNYGEMAYTEPVPKERGFVELLNAHLAGDRSIPFTHSIGIERLRTHTSPEFPGWNMQIPDVIRADVFLRELASFETAGEMPNFIIIYLPQDHGSGTKPGMPTPRAHMADNDLALGRIVEGISKSRFWPETVVFVNEDDPQDGFDHVDGHRSICLVVSAYTKRDRVISEFYNQTSVLHTICRIFGSPPMNQMVAIAQPMARCFKLRPDFSPYTASPSHVPLDELNPELQALDGMRRHWAEVSLQLNFEQVDAAPEDTLNRIIWHSVKGDEPYPAHFAGAHGSGLSQLGLRIDERAFADDH